MNLDVARRRLDDFAAVGLLVEALAADAHRRGHRHPLSHGSRRQARGTRAPARSQPVRRRGRRCWSASPAARSPGRSSAGRRGSAAGGWRGRAGSAAGRWRRGRDCRRARLWRRVRGGPSRRRRARSRRPACRRAAPCRSFPPCSAAELGGDLSREGTSQRPNSISVEKPAARLSPPPPLTRAIAETSTSPALARRLTLRAAGPRSPRSRITAATRTPSIERRWSIRPSVISSPAPVAS